MKPVASWLEWVLAIGKMGGLCLNCSFFSLKSFLFRPLAREWQ